MRIVYVASSVVPSRLANSVHIVKMCAAFAADGHDVSLYVPLRRREEEPAATDVFGFYGVAPSFRIRKFPWLPLPGKAQLWALWAVSALRRDAPDIVYGRDIIACALAARRGYRVVFESHIPAWLARGRSRTYFERLARSPRLVRIVAISQALKEMYIAKGYLDESRIMVAPDGSDEASPAAPLPDWPGRPGALQAGYAGRLHRGKGVDLVPAVAERCPEADFHILGGDADTVAAYRRRWAARPNIFFHGFMAPHRVPAFLARCDVCLLPNQRVVTPPGKGADLANIADVTSPLKLFEYMANGKCIVASDLPVLREVLNDANAVLAPPDSVESWCAALRRLHDAPTRRALGDRARADFTAKYTLRRRAVNVLAGLAQQATA